MNLRAKHFIITGIVFLIVASFFAFTASLEYQKNVDLEKQSVFDDLLMIQASLENIITSRMISSNSLAAFAELKNDFTQEEYENFAKRIYASASDIVHDMTFITDTRISHIYPYEAYKQVIGIDLASIEAQRDLILYAKEHLKSVFVAPVDLVEGGVGIIVRMPVVVHGEYFGQVAIVFNYENTLRASGLLKLSEKYHVELSGTDPFTGDKTVIWTNATKKFENHISNEVNLYDSKLYLTAMPKIGWHGESALFYILCGLGIVFSTTFAFGVYKMLDINRMLRATNDELASTVGQLIASEEQLKIQYDAIIDQKNYIKYLAEHDALTGLSNRRKFVETLSQSFTKGNKGAILILDLDNFKNINDSLGHVYGDRVLKAIAQSLETITKNLGHVYRFGGDEFFIMLPDIQTLETIESITKQISSCLDRGIIIDSFSNHVTVSIGISMFPQDASSVEELMSKADIAMYHAKREGKNQAHFFNHDMISVFEKRVNIEKKIHEALQDDGFMMYYQPIVDVRSGEVSSLEALIRLKDFSLTPDAFISVAEETMQIIPIGKWVIQEVLNQQVLWREMGLSLMPVAINLSPKQISDINLVEFIRLSLSERKLGPDALEIEVTENVLIDKRDESIKVLSEIKSLGIKIALDDFGTGFSSLNYLTFMPVDKIKIDKSLKDKFIHHENQKVMEGLVSIAHGLDIDVVVEGVETSAEVDKLIASGCDFLQGYHLGRPASSISVEPYIRNRKGYIK